MKSENSTCLTSIVLLLASAVPLVAWAASPRAHPFLGALGVVLYLAGGVFGIYGAYLATEPGETIPEMTKAVPTALAMKKAAGS
jgi:hypothetical protein